MKTNTIYLLYYNNESGFEPFKRVGSSIYKLANDIKNHMSQNRTDETTNLVLASTNSIHKVVDHNLPSTAAMMARRQQFNPGGMLDDQYPLPPLLNNHHHHHHQRGQHHHQHQLSHRYNNANAGPRDGLDGSSYG